MKERSFSWYNRTANYRPLSGYEIRTVFWVWNTDRYLHGTKYRPLSGYKIREHYLGKK